MADVLFILGAGCSADCGAPLSNTLLNVANDLARAGKVNADKAHFDEVETVRHLLGRVHTKADLDIDNVESVFSALDMGRTLQTLPGIDDGGRITAAVDSLKRVIVRTLEEAILFDTDDYGRPKATESYGTFADGLAEFTKRGQCSTAIITFNYDVALEVALAEKQIMVDYCFEPSPPNAMPLMKLHGSLNWFGKKNGSDVATIKEFGKAVKFVSKRNERRTRAALRFCEARPDLLARGQAEVYDEIPYIVPPTWSKGEHYRTISRVWQRAARELKDAKYLCILGYSLPPTDQFFRLLFALGTADGPPFRKICVGNTDPNVVRRVKRLLGLQAKGRLIDLGTPPSHAQFASVAERGGPGR